MKRNTYIVTLIYTNGRVMSFAKHNFAQACKFMKNAQSLHDIRLATVSSPLPED